MHTYMQSLEHGYAVVDIYFSFGVKICNFGFDHQWRSQPLIDGWAQSLASYTGYIHVQERRPHSCGTLSKCI